MIRPTMPMAAYSPKKKKAQRMPEYSVWKPPTSSDSASGRSKGARFTEASEEMKKMMQAMKRKGLWKASQSCMPPACMWLRATRFSDPATRTAVTIDRPRGTS